MITLNACIDSKHIRHRYEIPVALRMVTCLHSFATKQLRESRIFHHVVWGIYQLKPLAHVDTNPRFLIKYLLRNYEDVLAQLIIGILYLNYVFDIWYHGCTLGFDVETSEYISLSLPSSVYLLLNSSVPYLMTDLITF